MSNNGAGGVKAPDIPGFTYVEHLGKGGYSEVYLYEKVHPRMKVAVKVLTGENLTESARHQFMAEANAMAELADHPSIVQVFSADVTADGRPYLVMKYYPNKNMSVRAAEERLAVSDVLRIGIQISDAVETAHRAGILHRDIKPANILTGQFGATGLADFGLAATKGVEDTEESGGMSVPWAPPEVIFATSDADERSDVYSLGATVWHLLAGRSPFVVPGGDNSQWALMRRIQETQPPRTGRPDVPDSLDRLLQQAMAKDPSRRPQTALAFARALQGVEQEQRWPVTQILVDQIDRKPAHPSGLVDDDGATRQRPQRVEAQPRPVERTAPRAMPVFVGGDDATRNAASSAKVIEAMPGASTSKPIAMRARQFGPAAPELDGTVRRTVQAKVDTDEKDLDAPSRGSRTVLIVCAVLLGIGALVAGVLLASSPKSAKVQTQATATPNDGLDQNALGALEESAPGAPALRVSRLDPNDVQFVWTYTDPEAGDSFRWRSASGTDSGVVQTPVLVQKATAGQAQCVQVQVVRQDGSASSSWSDPLCSS